MGRPNIFGAKTKTPQEFVRPMHTSGRDHGERLRVLSTPERSHLEQAHHLLCTALTILRSNLELVHMEIERAAPPPPAHAILDHLSELDGAATRLESLARELRAWHAGEGEPRADAKSPLRP